MFLEYQKKMFALISLVLLVSSLAAARPRRTQRLQAGVWGGPHIRINVEPGSATIDYDCSNGTINGPLTLDRKGNFTWRGSHHRQHPGPIREGEESDSRPAIYSGSIKGDTMTLTVRLAGSNETVGTFTLTRGSDGRVFRCL